MPKKHDYLSEDVTLDGGRKVLWTTLRRTKGVGWEVEVDCLAHPRRWVRACDAFKSDFNALCRECIREDPPWKRTGELLLPKGTNILFDLRENGEPRRIGLQCRGCFKRTGEVKYVDTSNLYRYIKGRLVCVLAMVGVAHAEDKTAWCRLWPALDRLYFWDELCSDCVTDRGSLSKHTHDKVSKKSLTVTMFSLEDKETEMVPIVSELCKCLRWAPRDSAMNNWDIYEAICPYHQRRPRALAERLAFLGPPENWDSNGHKNGRARKPSGRPRDDRARQLLAAVNVVAALWQRVRNYNHLPFEKRLGLITQIDLAEGLGIVGQDDKTKRTQVAQRLKTCSVNNMFPGAKSWFQSFVKTVAEEIERGSASENIVLALESRLPTPRVRNPHKH